MCKHSRKAKKGRQQCTWLALVKHAAQALVRGHQIGSWAVEGSARRDEDTFYRLCLRLRLRLRLRGGGLTELSSLLSSLLLSLLLESILLRSLA